jgi:hypothetical protein
VSVAQEGDHASRQEIRDPIVANQAGWQGIQPTIKWMQRWIDFDQPWIRIHPALDWF